MAWIFWRLHVSRILALSSAMAGLLITSVGAVVAAALYWRMTGRAHHRRLRWDGTHWQQLSIIREPETLLTPHIRIDLGVALLLRARRATGGLPVHLALERRSAPAVWHALRVALGQAPNKRGQGPGLPSQGAGA